MQRTIKKKIKFEGIGLHTGLKTKLEILPSFCNSGVIFSRKDIPSTLIKADFNSVLDSGRYPRRTSVGANGVYVHTIEHLMAAFNLLRIDNVEVNLWGEEIPGLDGSAKGFIEEMRKAGIVEQGTPRNYLSTKEPLWVEEGQSSIVILPYPHLRVSYSLKYDDPLVGSSYLDITLNGEIKDNIYEARTFCLEDEVKTLMDMGLGKGANYENTLVVSEGGVIENELRFPDEFVKHKVLDLIGDLYLAGPLKGHVIAVKSGHSLNIKLLTKLRKHQQELRRGGVGSQESFVPKDNELSIEEIMKILPHRYPFLLVDKIVHLEKGEKAIGIKNVTFNEHFFQGHFPSRPVMPGVLIIEAMAQIGGVLMLACEEHRGKLAYFMAANHVKFRKTVSPGDQLFIEVIKGKIRSRTGSVIAKARVHGKVVAEGELMFALVDS
ncbi:MAG: UDP-3-O-acyl-N-acetylglucosamine deacetylase [Candidatus Omnitrophota bacterium]